MHQNLENVQLRVYSNFTEVREKLKIENGKYCKVTLPNELFQQIITHTTDVECKECKYQTVTKKSINLEGQRVHVRQPKTENGQESTKTVILVRGRDWLVQDVSSQRYYNVLRNQLEFDDMPTDNVYEVEFFFGDNCNQKETIFRYQLRTLKWKPKYELNVIDEISEEVHQTISCIAVIQNDSPVNYFVEKVELFGGDLGRNYVAPHQRNREVLMCDAVANRSAPKFPQSNFESTEMSGIYMYELLNQFQLNAYSSAYVEFIRPSVEVDVLSVIQLTNPANISKSMDRMYTIVSDEFLPSGILSIRQNDRMIGTHNLSDLPAKEKREIVLGQDSAALFRREETLVSQKKKQTILAVSLHLVNNHTKARRFRYREIFHLYQVKTRFEFKGSTCIKLIENGLEVNMDIPASTSSSFDYNVIKLKVSDKND